MIDDLRVTKEDANKMLTHFIGAIFSLIQRIEKEYSDLLALNDERLIHAKEQPWREAKETCVNSITHSLQGLFFSPVEFIGFVSVDYPSEKAKALSFTCAATLDHLKAYQNYLIFLRKEVMNVQTEPPVSNHYGDINVTHGDGSPIIHATDHAAVAITNSFITRFDALREMIDKECSKEIRDEVLPIVEQMESAANSADKTTGTKAVAKYGSILLTKLGEISTITQLIIQIMALAHGMPGAS